MARYMTFFAYTSDAWAALARNPQDRSQVLASLLQQLGGRLETFYYCFGEYDGVCIYELPDDTTAVAALITVSRPAMSKRSRRRASSPLRRRWRPCARLGA